MKSYQKIDIHLNIAFAWFLLFYKRFETIPKDPIYFSIILSLGSSNICSMFTFSHWLMPIRVCLKQTVSTTNSSRHFKGSFFALNFYFHYSIKKNLFCSILPFFPSLRFSHFTDICWISSCQDTRESLNPEGYDKCTIPFICLKFEVSTMKNRMCEIRDFFFALLRWCCRLSVTHNNIHVSMSDKNIMKSERFSIFLQCILHMAAQGMNPV